MPQVQRKRRSAVEDEPPGYFGQLAPELPLSVRQNLKMRLKRLHARHPKRNRPWSQCTADAVSFATISDAAWHYRTRTRTRCWRKRVARYPGRASYIPGSSRKSHFSSSILWRAGVDPMTAMAAVAGVAPALEVIDSRYENFRFSVTDVVADNTSAAAIVVGAWSSPPTDVANIGMLLEIDGVPRQTPIEKPWGRW